MDETGGHYTKSNKPDRERHDITYMWTLNKKEKNSLPVLKLCIKKNLF